MHETQFALTKWIQEILISPNMMRDRFDSIELPDLLEVPEVSVRQSLEVFALAKKWVEEGVVSR